MVEGNRYAKYYGAARGITREEALIGEWGMYGCDAAVWLIDALKKAGPSLDGDIQEALGNTTGLEHVDGTRYTSHKDHCGISPERVAVLLTVREGKLVFAR
ncbi:hypothetical protein ACFLTK_02775 [Chloroflexota bacterium]